ncbi:MAG: GxxExxY protein [Ignavibacteriaceae bacterium]|nr:GxxExxY protein [Ignavibacteriaceae bacterium]
MNSNVIYKEESFRIIGKCFYVYNILGGGLLEVVYKDALEYEFKSAGIPRTREKEYKIHYKDITLPHTFYADFVVMDKIILEVKSIASFAAVHTAQLLNYLAISNMKLGLLVNFGPEKVEYKRIVR